MSAPRSQQEVAALTQDLQTKAPLRSSPKAISATTFPFAVSVSFAKIGNGFSVLVTDYDALHFLESLFSNSAYFKPAQAWPAQSKSFNSDSPLLEASISYPTDASATVEDGITLMMQNTQTGDSLTVGANPPTGSNVTDTYDTDNGLARRFGGIVHFASGWRATYSRGYNVQIGFGGNSGYPNGASGGGSIFFVPPDEPSPEELTLRDGDTDELVATSNPAAYAGPSSDPIASLDSDLGALAATTLNLSKSNDNVTLKLPAPLLIRYITKRTGESENLAYVNVTITTSQSNKIPLTVSLPRTAMTSTNVQFQTRMQLVSGPASVGQIGIQPVPNSFTTFDYNSGDGANYDDGNAQDGLYWENREKAAGRTPLGRAAKLRPAEKTSVAYRPNIPPTQPALQAAGYEDLIVERQQLKAWTRVKNQANRLYVSSHGFTWGDIVSDGVGTGSGDVNEYWASGNLDLAIFAGCSVLDIGNFNGWENTSGTSPGRGWKTATRAAVAGKPGCVLLGYNATAPLANTEEPAGSLHADTRVLGFYYDQLTQQGRLTGQELTAMAWMIANAQMEQRIADDACAITDDYYYFMRTIGKTAGNRVIKDPHDQNEPGSRNLKRAIWRIHRDFWGRVGIPAFDAIPQGQRGKTLMRQLPPAAMGESGKI